MNQSIAFPNLGIFLKNVAKEFSIGPLTVTCYGIMIALGMILGIALVERRARESGQDGGAYIDICVIVMAAAIVGARIYYVLFSLEDYISDPLAAFRIWEGGLAVYGGVIAGSLAAVIIARIKKMSIPLILDTCIIGVPLGQSIGRWGNFFNREAFGTYTNSLFAMRLPVSAVRAWEISPEAAANMLTVDGTEYILAHPCFLYESALNILVLLLLLYMRKRTAFKGELFLIYLAAYGIVRAVIEPLRTDQLKIAGTGIPASLALSLALVVVSLSVIVCRRIRLARAQGSPDK